MLLFLLACATSPPDPPAEPPIDVAQQQAKVDELLLAGETDAAIEAARAVLNARQASHEPGTPERSRAHRVLASALLAAGEHDEALEHARLAIDGAESPEDALLLLGQVQAAAGKPVDLPDVPFDERALREAVVLRLSSGGGDHLVSVLAALAADHPSEALHGTLAGLAWQDGDPDVALASVGWLEHNGSPQARLEGGLLRARIEEQRGDTDAAIAAYEQTCGTVEPAFQLRCERERGLFLAQLPDHTDAARTALRKAARSDDPSIAGRSLAALGILEAHEGSEDAARPALEDALMRLPPSHPEADFARRHLEALGTGACGCEAPTAPLDELLFDRAHEAFPGLVQDVSIDAEGAVQMTLSRDATPEEQAGLAALQEQVLAELP